MCLSTGNYRRLLQCCYSPADSSCNGSYVYNGIMLDKLIDAALSVGLLGVLTAEAVVIFVGVPSIAFTLFSVAL